MFVFAHPFVQNSFGRGSLFILAAQFNHFQITVINVGNVALVYPIHAAAIGHVVNQIVHTPVYGGKNRFFIGRIGSGVFAFGFGNVFVKVFFPLDQRFWRNQIEIHFGFQTFFNGAAILPLFIFLQRFGFFNLFHKLLNRQHIDVDAAVNFVHRLENFYADAVKPDFVLVGIHASQAFGLGDILKFFNRFVFFLHLGRTVIFAAVFPFKFHALLR